MIVDDTSLVLGSANINDRSMLGSRDSELGVCIEGPVDSFVPAGSFGSVGVSSKVAEFRKRIFEEHYGMVIEDPASEETWRAMWGVAKMNTMVYNRVFKVYPSDEYPSFSSLKNRNKDLDENLFNSVIGNIRGHAVLYPYDFLKDEDLISAKNSELSMMVVPIYALQ